MLEKEEREEEKYRGSKTEEHETGRKRNNVKKADNETKANLELSIS